MNESDATTTSGVDPPVSTPMETVALPPLLPPPPQGPTEDSSFSSPVSVLPLGISLATLVTIIIAACVIYRKRQNKRSQDLAKQLRVTERRIDAIGNIKAKKEQELLGFGNRKTEYNPPEAAPCSSATSQESQQSRELEVKYVVAHTLPQHTQDAEATTSPAEYQLKVCKGKVEVTKAPNPSTNAQSKREDETDCSSSYYCSTCEGSASATTVQVGHNESQQEPVDSSLAVECETIPSASSLSTVIGSVLSQQKRVQRSQSEHHHVTGKQPSHKRLSAISAWTNYSHIVKNLRHGSKQRLSQQGSGTASSKTKAASHAGSWGATKHSYSSMNALPQSNSTAPGQSLGGKIAGASRKEDGSCRPNTPVSSGMDITTDTDGEKEKWV